MVLRTTLESLLALNAMVSEERSQQAVCAYYMYERESGANLCGARAVFAHARGGWELKTYVRRFRLGTAAGKTERR